MIMEKRAGRWWVYFDHAGAVASAILHWLYNPEERGSNGIASWLDENASGRWRTDARIYHRRGDYREFMALRFSAHDDALMFYLAFAEEAPDEGSSQPAWKNWPSDRRSDPLAMTFEPWGNRTRYFQSGLDERGRVVTYNWSTSRNAVGKFLAWESRDHAVLARSVRAFDKRKDAKEWAWTKAQSSNESNSSDLSSDWRYTP